MKAAQTEPFKLIINLFGFYRVYPNISIDQLSNKEHDVLEIGCGMGNLAETILNNTNKKRGLSRTGMDDLLMIYQPVS